MVKVDWDTLFMSMAYLVAEKSKDRSTHVGAVIVGPNNEVRSVGYNSFPRRVNDDVEARQERPEKYSWFAHAETNSIANAALAGIRTEGCRMYTNGIPCDNCANMILNAGIAEVIVDATWDKNNYNQWLEQAARTRTKFAEAGIKLRFWDGEFLRIRRFRDGVEI